MGRSLGDGRRTNLRFGVGLLVAAVLFVICACFAPGGNLAQTSGVIIAAEVRPLISTVRRAYVRYAYTADGTRRGGEGYAPYYSRFPPRLTAGANILVWFDRSDPSVSFPMYRPSRLSLLLAAAIPGAVGATIVFFALRQ